jgi:hypothetical protein
MRYIVTGVLSLATIAWLVISYMPGVMASLPKWAFDSQFVQVAFPWLAAVSLLIFLIIQLDVVRATAQWFGQSAQSSTGQALVDFGLQRGWELFWTGLPLLGTALLAFWLLIGS